MIEAVAASVPEALSAYRGGVAAGPGGPDVLPLASLHDPAVFEAVLGAFAAGCGAGCGAADGRAVVSYWSQHYFAALATPALTALLRLGRPLPLAFDAVGLELDAAGRPARFRLAATEGGETAPGLAGLVEGHLRPLVALCHARCGLAPRVLWGNAAVILDYVARELGAAGDETRAIPVCAPGCAIACASARAEVAACLGWRGGPACRMSPLAGALCPAEPAGGPCARRRVCCLRYRLPGIPSCGALCPAGR